MCPVFTGSAGVQSSQPPGKVSAVKQNMLQSAKGARKPKLPGFPNGSAAAAAAAVAALKQRQQQLYDEQDEEEEEDAKAGPEFQITFDQGKTVRRPANIVAELVIKCLVRASCPCLCLQSSRCCFV